MRKVEIATAVFAATLSFGEKIADASVGSSCKRVGAVNAATGLKCVNRKGKRVWEQFYSVPGKPSFVLFTANNGSLTIGNPGAWGNPVATLFVIQMRSTVALDWATVAETSIVNRSLTVSGLVPGVGYEIRVAAKNPYGTGEFSSSGLSYATGSVVATTTTIVGIGAGGQTTTTTTALPTTTTSTTISNVSAGQSQASKKAASYLRSSAFSRQGLIDQLLYEGFSLADATYGTDAQNADWNAQAVKKGASYLRSSAFSRSRLIGQLEYSGFTNSQATYGTDQQNANWNEQAAKKAASYLRSSSFSRSGLINQLLYEGFSQAEAEYGVNSVGL